MDAELTSVRLSDRVRRAVADQQVIHTLFKTVERNAKAENTQRIEEAIQSDRVRQSDETQSEQRPLAEW